MIDIRSEKLIDFIGDFIFMIIGLIDVDGKHFPNLALMKLSAFHKRQNDSVEWYNPFNQYDIVYKSKVFTFTPDYQHPINNSKQVISGGTGYNDSVLENDNIQPDYSIYGIKDVAYGFTTRGCIRKCQWCLVPKKEGWIHSYMDIEEIAQDRKSLILMDNNVLASDHGLIQIEKSIKLKLKLDFNQGLDARIIMNDIEIVKLLSKVKWLKPLRMACDSSQMKEPIRKATELLRKYKCTPNKYSVYVLLSELYDSYDRINFCQGLKLDAFAQPYRDFTPYQIIPQWQNDLARYTNCKAIYKTCDFKDYSPRKGFKCSEYFCR